MALAVALPRALVVVFVSVGGSFRRLWLLCDDVYPSGVAWRCDCFMAGAMAFVVAADADCGIMNPRQ